LDREAECEAEALEGRTQCLRNSWNGKDLAGVEVGWAGFEGDPAVFEDFESQLPFRVRVDVGGVDLPGQFLQGWLSEREEAFSKGPAAGRERVRLR
jgi:hypothetical protein